jgi:predicted amidohydrolase YtcJ
MLGRARALASSRLRALPFALALALALVATPVAAQPADLVLVNGRVVTMDPARPEAQAIAMRGDRILAVGSDGEVREHVGTATRVIDLQGKLAVPGFIEGHGHYTGLGTAKLDLDLTTATSWDDIVALVRDAAANAAPGEVIRGRGWHQEKWSSTPPGSVDGVPTHHALSAVSPDNPVVLSHASGHATFVNAKAMALSGIGRATADPAGGTVVKGPDGEPTGLLRETASGLVRVGGGPQTPEAQEARFRQIVQLAGDEALAHGITSFHDAGSNFRTIDGFKRLADEGKLPVRLYVMVRGERDARLDSLLPRYRMEGYGNGFLTVRAIKMSIDGALGPHGAWLMSPYADKPETAGLNTTSTEQVESTARVAIRHGFQINVHAIGDRANKETLDIYEQVFRDNPDRRDLRWRIEHAQHLRPEDVPRFRTLGVIASMQGIHGTSDGPWVLKRLGEERARSGAYLWRSLLDAGVVVTNGTDVPVEPIDPLASYAATVTRRMRDGTPFFPGQAMTRLEALASYTINNAYASFQEDVLGSLTSGKLADVVVLSHDILTVPDAELPKARVLYTILGGAVRYEAPVVHPVP